MIFLDILVVFLFIIGICITLAVGVGIAAIILSFALRIARR